MAANMYDQAAQAQFINTYAPINFGELFRIGAAQKEEMDRAAQQFGAQLQKFGEFRSPSAVDTQRYYDLTTGRQDIQDAINQMVSNPDALKDASFRSSLQSLINNVDYSSLSKLKQSAENLDARQKMIAQMRAAGKYNQNWDDINIGEWNTLEGGIMTDLAPIEYLTANALSNAYFDNLKPSTLSPVYKDGVKYQRQGITYDTLKGIADARFNDLIRTPQGQKYYEDALRSANGNEDIAREAFTTMIADSQRDRIVEQETVDPYWLAQAKHSMTRSGSTEIVRPQPTRLDFLNDTMYKSVKNKVGARLDTGYRDYIQSLITKYPNTKIAEDAKKGLANIDNMTDKMVQLGEMANLYAKRYEATGSDQDFINYNTAFNMARDYQNRLLQQGNKYVLRNEFQNVAGFSPISVSTNKEFNTEKYLSGINSALDVIKGKIGITKDDELLTAVGGRPSTVVNDNGTTNEIFNFDSSNGFLMPETIFNIAADVKPREIKRAAGTFRSGDFPLKELVEGGKLKDVQFKPDNGVIKIGDNFALSGKIRIPKDEITRYISTGIFSLPRGKQYETTNFPTTVQSIRSSIENLFGGRKVTEKVGEDGKEFYEIESYKVLPKEDISSEYWQRVNQSWQGGKSGLGGASQAKDTYMDSAEQLLSGV